MTRQASKVVTAGEDADRKRIATVTARAALAGLVLRPLADGAWQVLNPAGDPCTVQSLQAVEALVCGCEQAIAEMAALLGPRAAPGCGGAR